MQPFTSNNRMNPTVDAVMLRVTDVAPADYLCNLATNHGVTILSITPNGVIVGYHKNTESEQHVIAMKNELNKRYGNYTNAEDDNKFFLTKIFDKFKRKE